VPLGWAESTRNFPGLFSGFFVATGLMLGEKPKMRSRKLTMVGLLRAALRWSSFDVA
jgi:hypothetical protein